MAGYGLRPNPPYVYVLTGRQRLACSGGAERRGAAVPAAQDEGRGGGGHELDDGVANEDGAVDRAGLGADGEGAARRGRQELGRQQAGALAHGGEVAAG